MKRVANIAVFVRCGAGSAPDAATGVEILA